MVIREENKIQYIALAQEIENSPEMTVNKAFTKAKKELNFNGNIGDFIDLMKMEGLLTAKDEQTEKEIEEITKKRKTRRVNKALYVVVAAGVIYLGVSLLNKKTK